MYGNGATAMVFSQTTLASTTFTHSLFTMIANDSKLTTLSSFYNESWITESDNVTPGRASGNVIRLYTSELERIMFLLYIWMSGLVSLLLNVIVLLIIIREPRLHTPENFIIAFDAINNMVEVLCVNSFMLAVLHTNNVTPNYYACQISGSIISITFLYNTYVMFVYSYDRYSFLCFPMTYAKRVTKSRLAAAMIILLIPTCGLTFLPTFPNYTRVFSATGLTCVSQNVVKSTIAGLCVLGLPTIGMVLYAVVNIKRLQSRWEFSAARLC